MTDLITSPENFLSDVLKKAKALGASDADVSLETSQSLSVEVRGGKLENVEQEESRGLSLRCFQGQRQAHVSGSDLSKEGVDALIERAVAMAKVAPEDEYCGLAPSEDLAKDWPELDLKGEPRKSADELEQMARAAEDAVMSHPGILQAEHCTAAWGGGASWVAATNGFSANAEGGSIQMAAMGIAEKDGAMERDYESRGMRYLEDMPTPKEIGNTAAERTLARLGAQKIESQTAAVIYDKRLSAQLLSSFKGAISGAAIARGVSFLKDKLGEQVFGSDIEIIDDPFMARGLGSRRFDGEGRAVNKKALIENGVLTQWMLHGPSAKQLGLKPNGFASGGFGDPPGVGGSNFFMKAGEKSQAELMKDAGKGLLITDMFGPSINPNNGDYSVGVAGFWFEDGTILHPVSEVTVAGNLVDMFLRLIPASDLEMRGSVNAPSLLIEGMTIAGS